jgi:hypothetical protein
MSNGPTKQRPVHLQLNNSGAWKNLVSFDADMQADADKAMEAAELLQQVNAKTRFRIVTQGSLPAVLMTLESGKWSEA